MISHVITCNHKASGEEIGPPSYDITYHKSHVITCDHTPSHVICKKNTQLTHEHDENVKNLTRNNVKMCEVRNISPPPFLSPGAAPARHDHFHKSFVQSLPQNNVKPQFSQRKTSAHYDSMQHSNNN